jgi:hypothetical protein
MSQCKSATKRCHYAYDQDLISIGEFVEYSGYNLHIVIRYLKQQKWITKTGNASPYLIRNGFAIKLMDNIAFASKFKLTTNGYFHLKDSLDGLYKNI